MYDLFRFGITTELDPIIVSSPTIRCGTTLLQRLLCSSSNGLIYGEECGKDLELALQVYVSRLTVYAYSGNRVTSRLQKVLEGDVNEWITDLVPEMEGYLEALGRGCFAGMTYCRDYAAGIGRPRWGLKYPGWSSHVVGFIRRFMPQSKFVFIYRDIVDCVRSAKARGSIFSEQEVKQFCQTWADNLSFMLRMKDESGVMLLSYTELITGAEKSIERLSHFTGITGMRPTILSHKINAREGVSGTDQTGYMEPAQLTESERIIAEETAAALKPALLALNET